ncbi:NAD(P)-binding protein [Nocardia vinacea]|uniref:NAD(P)-binding protein n=1 Tax=Nocardia vinacea TaxID=96468 RepID=UPI003F4D0D0D
MSDYDAIVIGAGNAGLTAAATLQRAGSEHCCWNDTTSPGCGTSFHRGRFECEVALHQLSGVGVDRAVDVAARGPVRPARHGG